MRQTIDVTERRVCRTLGQHRSTQRKAPGSRDDEGRLTADIVELARQYGRYGYRRITAMLGDAGWQVNHKRVERIWRREGLKVPRKQPKRARLWLNDGSCIRLRPERPNHVWSYDFVQDRTHDGRAYRMLNIIDEFTREALMIRLGRKLSSIDVIDALTDLFILRGPPQFIRSDNGPEFVAKPVRDWIAAVGATTALHRTRFTLGERLLRELQRQTARRASQRRDLLHPQRGSNHDRDVAPPLQHGAATQRSRVETAGPRNHRSNRPEAADALTFNLDHLMGAAQRGAEPVVSMAPLDGEGGAAAVGSDEPVVGSSEVRRLEERMRDLERLLGRKTMEVEILKEALAKAQSKKPILRLVSQPKDGSR